MSKQAKRDFQQEIVNSIIEKLEQGIKPWVRPWVDGAGCAIPTNFSTKKEYNGMNVWLLWMAAEANGYSSNYWLTYKQAQELGGQVRKGEKSTMGIFYKMHTKDEGTDAEKSYPIAKPFFAFNLDQIEGIEPDQIDAPLSAFQRNERVEAFIEAQGAEIRYGGNSAYYSPAQDFIGMPHREQFNSEGCFYGTLTHELSHRTGHSSRLNREYGRRGTDLYCIEEMVAEMSSCLLTQTFGIDGEMQHEDYIAAYLKKLREDKRHLFRAATAASKAYEYMMANYRAAVGEEGEAEENAA